MRQLLAVILLATSFTARGESIGLRRDAFQEAVDTGNAATARRELKAGVANVNRFNHLAGTPLALAVRRGHAKVVAVLLEFKADVTAPENAALFPDGWNLRCGARLHGAAIDAMLAKARASPPTAGCLTDLKLILAAKKGSERDVRAAQFPDGLSLAAAGLALEYAIASEKPAVVTAVIEVSGNPRLPEHANLPFRLAGDPEMRRALGEVERRSIPELVK
ncbi:MAG: hypothetical protein Q8L14_10290 [Myxococcales bacterium]|nr:hypothetical protein [Myxococcales bacterium]